MSDDLKMGLSNISDFEWASGARYIMYVSLNAGLTEVGSNAIFSFRVGKGGVKALLASKRRVADALERNLKLLEQFAGEYSESLGRSELSIIRGMYRANRDALAIIEGHIGVCGEIVSQVSLLSDGEEEREDVLF